MFRFNKALSGAFIVLLVLAIPLVAQSQANLTSIKIKNFGRINDQYFRGGQPEGHDYADLAALGVRTVINLTSDDAMKDEQSMVETAGMKYHQIPMMTHQQPTGEELTEFLSIVNDPANQPVYVHCVGGKHRTGVMTAVYRMSQDQWTADQAFEEMKKYKFGSTFLHPEFKRFVYDYYDHIDRAPVALQQGVATAKTADASQ